MTPAHSFNYCVKPKIKTSTYIPRILDTPNFTSKFIFDIILTEPYEFWINQTILREFGKIRWAKEFPPIRHRPGHIICIFSTKVFEPAYCIRRNIFGIAIELAGYIAQGIDAYNAHKFRVEGVHGEAKACHGLHRATRRGLANMAIRHG